MTPRFDVPSGSQTSTRLNVRDVLTAALGAASGPVLLWMAVQLIDLHRPAAGALSQVENVVGILCAVLGMALALLWVVYALIAVVIIGIARLSSRPQTASRGLKFLPGSLRRILLVVLGAQLVFAPSAFADSTGTEVDGWQPTLSFQEVSPSPENTSASESPLVAPTLRQPSTPSASPRPDTAQSHHQLLESLSPTAETDLPSSTPEPRQTSTIEMVFEDAWVPRRSVELAESERQRQLTEPETVTVTRGDSLWDLARDELGAFASDIQVDARWRVWWHHNRHIIGDDPHCLEPGQVLEVPPWTQEYSEH